VLDSTYPSILQYSDHLFLLRTDTPGYAPGCAWYARNVLGLKSMAIIGAAADPYSVGLIDWIKKSAPAYGLDITAEADYPSGTTDFGPFIQQVMATKPQSLYLGGVTAEQLPVLKQLRQSGITIPVFHSSGVTPDQAKSILGPSVYVNMMKSNYDCAGTLPITSTSPQTLAFAKAYEQATGNTPQDLTMWAYDYPVIVARAMEQAGTATDRQKIYQALLAMPVPAGTISGWTDQGGKLFDGRKAITPSQIMAWCPAQQTIKPTLTYVMDSLQVTQRVLVKDPCTG
jgi:ABC-type branched-subunit amino acid transport system substrate-binding protein